MTNKIASLLMSVAALGLTAAPAAAAPYHLEKARAQALDTCMIASFMSVNDADKAVSVAGVIDAMWFSVETNRAKPAGELMSTVGGAFDKLDKMKVLSIKPDAARLRTVCGKRFPLSQHGRKIILPADSLMRRAMCVNVTALAQGMAQSAEAKVLLARTEKVLNRVETILPDKEMADRGYKTDDSVTALFGRMLVQAHDLGNLNDVLESCLTELK